MTRRVISVLAIAIVPLAVCPGLAAGHALSNSRLVLTLEGDGVAKRQLAGALRVKLRDLDAVLGLDRNGDLRLSDPEVHAQADVLTEYLLTRLELRLVDRPCTLGNARHAVGGEDLTVAFSATCAGGGTTLSVRYDLFLDHDPRHKGLFQLVEDDRAQTAVFRSDRRVKTFELSVDDFVGPVLDYAREGIWHIWIGFDHLLFLLTLLLPAVLVRTGSGWRRVERFGTAFMGVAKIVSAFTVAHSITLVLAATEVVRLPSRLVEACIAASVILAALNNLYPVVTRRGWLLAFAFGLVHGFGFASVLTDLGLPRSLLSLALLSFNVGVELGQLAVVAVFLPLAYLASRARLYPRACLGYGSLSVALIAGVWLLERAVDAPLDQVAKRALHPGAPDRAARLLARGEQQLRSGHLEQARAALERAREIQASLGHAAALSRIYTRLGDLAVARAHLPRAREMYAAARDALSADEDPAGRAASHENLARTARLAGELTEAARDYRRALELYEHVGDEVAVERVCLQLGGIYRRQRQYPAALAALQRAAEIDERLGRMAALADAQAKLGIVQQLRRDLDRAARAFGKAVALDSRLARKAKLANHHANLGNVYRDLGQAAQAREHYAKSLSLFEAMGSDRQAGKLSALMAGLENRGSRD